MAGLNKRIAEFIPKSYRGELDRLSKADILEIAYSFAVMLNGEECAVSAFSAIKREHETLCANQSRKPVNLKA